MTVNDILDKIKAQSAIKRSCSLVHRIFNHRMGTYELVYAVDIELQIFYRRLERIDEKAELEIEILKNIPVLLSKEVKI